MYANRKVIDVHGHVSTPPEFRAHAYNLICSRESERLLDLSFEKMRPAVERHLTVLDERSIDIQLLSPRPVAMMHWEQPHLVRAWTRTTNDVIHEQCRHVPDRFLGVAQLPQSFPGPVDPCVEELTRTADELGFVGAILNPDPTGTGQAPGLDDPYWYPIYEAAQRLRTTLVIHPSISRDPRLAPIPRSYQYNNVVQETLATLLYEETDVLERFPDLRVVVPHCGGALNRFLAAAEEDRHAVGGQYGLPPVLRGGRRHAARPNLYFDSCAYDPGFLSTALAQRSVARTVLGTEAPGSGSGVVDPRTGRPSDDVVAVLDGLPELGTDDVIAIVHDNPLRAFPRIRLTATG